MTKQIEFYTNKRQEIYDNTIDVDSMSCQVFLLDDSYEFDESHTIQDLSSSILSTTSTVLTSKQISNELIIDCEDLLFENLLIHKNSVAKSIVFVSDSNELLFVISGYSEMPLLINGSDLLFVISNSYKKLLVLDSNSIDPSLGNVIIEHKVSNVIKRPKEIYSRPGGSLSPEQEFDKSGYTGKASLYKDISITGRAHPLTGDITTVSGVHSINQSLRNILLTNTYERPYSSKDVAGNINAMLFEYADNITKSELQTGIAIAINNYEPRISVVNIIVETIPESYSLNVTIIYIIKTTNSQEQYSIILERA